MPVIRIFINTAQHCSCSVVEVRPLRNSQFNPVEGLVNLDGPNKLDARGVPGLGLVISLVSLCTCYAVASASKVVLPAIASHKSRQAFGNRRAR